LLFLRSKKLLGAPPCRDIRPKFLVSSYKPTGGTSETDLSSFVSNESENLEF